MVRAGLAATAILMAALLGEGVLRTLYPGGLQGDFESGSFPWIVFDPLLSWRNLPGYRHKQFSIGEHGDRLVRAPVTPDPQAPRVLFLGDSRTFGVRWEGGGFRYDSDFASYLARRAGPRLEVLNGGTIGYTSSQGLRQWMLVGDRIDPDVVVVAFGMNENLVSWNPSYRVSEPRSALARVLLYRFGGWRWVQGGFWVARRSPWSPTKADGKPWVELEEYHRNLERFADEMRRRDVRLLFLHLPLRPLESRDDEGLIPGEKLPLIRYGVDNLEELYQVHDRFRGATREVAERHDIPMLDVSHGFRAFRKRRPSKVLYSAHDRVHPNAQGAKVIATLLEQRLLSLGWMAPR